MLQHPKHLTLSCVCESCRLTGEVTWRWAVFDSDSDGLSRFSADHVILALVPLSRGCELVLGGPAGQGGRSCLDGEDGETYSRRITMTMSLPADFNILTARQWLAPTRLSPFTYNIMVSSHCWQHHGQLTLLTTSWSAHTASNIMVSSHCWKHHGQLTLLTTSWSAHTANNRLSD